MTSNDLQWPRMIHFWLFLALLDYFWQFPASSDFFWPFLALSGSFWLFLPISAYVWLFLAFFFCYFYIERSTDLRWLLHPVIIIHPKMTLFQPVIVFFGLVLLWLIAWLREGLCEFGDHLVTIWILLGYHSVVTLELLGYLMTTCRAHICLVDTWPLLLIMTSFFNEYSNHVAKCKP